MSALKNTNLTIVNPNEAMKAIEVAIRIKKPIMLHGPPGIGKSEVVAQIGRKLKRPVIDIRLGQMSETDVRGIPYYNSDTKKMEWAPPSVFPFEEDSNAIIFLDEITQAAVPVQAAGLQLIHDRCIGAHRLGPNVDIIAAGNRAGDKTGAKAMIAALKNRFMHLHVEHNFDQWREWAMHNGVHPDVIGYLSIKQHHLNTFNPETVSTRDAYATPRSWVHFVSKTLLDYSDIDNITLRTIVAGSVGEEIATEFMTLHDQLLRLPKPDDVCAGRVKKMPEGFKGSKTAAEYSIATSCLQYLAAKWQELAKGKEARNISEDIKKEFGTYMDNFFVFVLNNVSPEVGTMALTTAAGNMGLMVHKTYAPTTRDFLAKNRGILSRASQVIDD